MTAKTDRWPGVAAAAASDTTGTRGTMPTGWCVTGGDGWYAAASYHYFFLKGLKALRYGQNTAIGFFNCFQYWNRHLTHSNCPIHILVWGEA